VPPSVYLDFLAHLFPTYSSDRTGIGLSYAPEVSRWVLDADHPATLASVENRKTWGTRRVTALELVEDGLRLRSPVVKDPVPGPGDETRMVRNEAETAAAQAKLQEIRERWASWLPQDPARAAVLESEYNARFNRWRTRRYDGSHLTFPKLALTYQGQPLRLRAHQAAGAQRIMERGEEDDTVGIFYAPGLGKTLCAIVGAVKRLQVGLSDRAVVVVPKTVLGQWRQTLLDAYPDLADWVLSATDDEFGDPARRRAFLVRAAVGDAPVVLLTYEQFHPHPVVVFGHKSLVADRLDAPALSWDTAASSISENRRLMPGARLIAYARGRTTDIKHTSLYIIFN
jgi:N12 class adenine-specific DNA methylase